MAGQCPLWVISGHFGLSAQCPLYPQKQTLVEPAGMSALCQKRTCQLLRLYVDLLLNNNRKCERKCGALARLRLNPNPSAVHLNDALRYSESQAGAALLAGNRIVGLLKLLKQLGLIGGGNAGSGVTDRYMECAIVRFRLDGDLARIGELDRITDEIDQDLR